MTTRSLLMLLAGFSGACLAQAPTALWLRGYSVIPTPRHVRLSEGDVQIDGSWVLDPGSPGAQGIAARTLLRDFDSFHGIALQQGSRGRGVIRLSVAAGTVSTKADPEIDRQAYRLHIEDGVIEITGNSAPGLFYGVQTLVQLARRDTAGRLLVPKADIEDWPTFQLRFLHWDSKHHQDRMETLKHYLDWAARFKVNMIGFELEDKFEYPSHPVIGAPGAFTTAQLQEIVNYGLERYIQVVPEIQSPAHFAYVLKHPEFAALRADGNNYQSDLCDPRTYDLIFSMYDDAIKATRGVDYFFVSTDEVYFAGIGDKCGRPYNPVNRSLAWVEFVRKAHDFLSARGRRMLIWAEYPLLPEHVKMIPPDVIDGVMGNPQYLATENELGMRQLVYVAMSSSRDYLFPNHFTMETQAGFSQGRLQSAFAAISSGRVWQGKPIGVFGAAWDDSGTHRETVWLGWSAVARYGWTPGTPGIEQHAAEFMNVYYGPRTTGMVEIYQALQRLGDSWQRTWDRAISKARAPGYGNSFGRGIGTQRYDMTLTPPAIPKLPDLSLQPSFAEKYEKFLSEAHRNVPENDRLIHALQENLPRVDRNRFNLEVFLVLANMMGHHWRLLLGLADAERSLDQAQAAAKIKNPARAVSYMVAACNTADRLQKECLTTYNDLKAVYEKSHYPKGRSVGGRRFVHILDDTKDHWADRRADLSFLIAPEQSIELERWSKDLRQVIQAYAKQNKVAVRGLEEARLEE